MILVLERNIIKRIVVGAATLLLVIFGLREMLALPDSQCGARSENSCGQEKAIAIASQEQQIITFTSIPLPVQGTPVPEDYVAPEDLVIEPIDDLSGFVAIPTLRYANTIWKSGVV
jgi:hypothetical protein